MHCSQSLMKLSFSPMHAQQKLKTASLSLPASLPPSSWSAGFYCLLQRSPGTPGLGASLLSQLWTQQALLSVLPMGLQDPSASCCPVLSSLPATCSPLGHVLPGHSCRISGLPPNVLESMWVSSLGRIPSPPPALSVMFPKAHWTLHSMMSG